MLPDFAFWLLVLPCAVAGVGGMYVLCRWREWQAANWEGRPIPSGVGSGFVPALWAAAWFGPAPASPRWPVLVVITGFAVLGFVDDRWGNREVSGLRGHVQALLSGRMTTGAGKLLGGTALAVWAGFVLHPNDGVRALPAAAVIALSANAINLLDCRPSRAVKGVWVYALATFAGGYAEPFLGGVLLATVVYAPLDFRCRAMMGDAGANMLGATLGACWAAQATLPVQLALAAALLAGHGITERVSLTKVIERHAVLRWLDGLGVHPAGNA